MDPEQIGAKIGRVTKYSDQEGTYSGNFSNVFPIGTEYYTILGIDRKEAIAVKADETLYLQADYGGAYAGGWSWRDYVPFLLVIPILLVGIRFIRKRL